MLPRWRGSYGRTFCAALACLALASGPLALRAEPDATDVPVTAETLDNGLRVVIVENHEAQISLTQHHPFDASDRRAYERELLRAPVGGGYSARAFAVPGVPGAKGLLEDSPDEGDNAGVVWVQGRCVLIIGDLAVSGTAATTPLVSAARSVLRRCSGGERPSLRSDRP